MTLEVAAYVELPEASPVSPLRDIALLKRLWPFIRPHRRLLGLSLLLLVPVTLAQVSLPVIVRQAVDGPLARGDVVGLAGFCLLYLGVMGLHYGLRYQLLVLSQTAGQRIVQELRTGLYRHLQALSPDFYHRTPVGKLVTRLTNDVENLSEMFSSGGLYILLDLAVVVGALAAMAWQDLRLALIACLAVLVIAGVIEGLRRSARRAYDDIRVKVAALNAFLQENLSGMEIVQLYRREKRNARDFRVLNRKNLAVNLRSVFYDSTISAVVEFVTLVTLVLILWVGSQAIGSGGLSFGLLIAFFLYIQMVFEPLEDMAEKYTIIQAGLASIDKIMHLFDERPALAGPAVSRAWPSEDSGASLRFESVGFRYGPEGPKILDDLSFQVDPGEVVALVGPTGAGKTTVIKLLCRFYDPQEGRILLDGRDIRSFSLADLRKRVVVIQQDDVVFSRSVAENIALDPDWQADPAVGARILNALETVLATPVLERLPAGIHTPLQERGRNLSQGERQLLLFARAVYHDPLLLVLDEATSAIDPLTERRVQAALDRVMAGRTTLVVAHRLSTIQKANRILVLDHGKLLESGTHEALLAAAGLYSRFCQYAQSLDL